MIHLAALARPQRRFVSFLAALVLTLVASSTALRAHSHLDVQLSGNQLVLVGPATETMVYVPPGEPFSTYAPQFPGGHYACELTFSTEDPDNFTARVQLLSVTGPDGGSFAFWEVGATAPTWARATGWTSTETDRPSLVTYEDGTGYGHIHGRLFTATAPGAYTVVFRAVDDGGQREPSAPKSITINVLATPQLSIRVESGEARLTFASRADLTYDLQVSTDLVHWAGTGVEAHTFVSGTGDTIEFDDPLADRPRVFYRLVEYF